MDLNHVRLDSTFERAESLITQCITNNNMLSIGAFNSQLSNPCPIKHFNIVNVGRNPDDNANISVSVIYTITEPDDIGVLHNYEKERTFNFLTTIGDMYWTPNMILKVFDNEIPSTVGIDTATGEVFLVYLKYWGMELKYFATLTNEQLALFEDLNLDKPFKIDILPRAMFKYIDGAEGTNYLKQNLFIEFDCGHPLELKIETAVERVI